METNPLPCTLVLLGASLLLLFVNPPSAEELDPIGYSEDLHLAGNDTRTFTTGVLGNITLEGDSHLRIVGKVTIIGWVRIGGNATFRLQKATVEIYPPTIDRDDNVLSVRGTGRLMVTQGSVLVLNPQPVHEEDPGKRNNASFVEIDDNAVFQVLDSRFEAKLPQDVVPEATRVTGGTILVTGYGSFIAERAVLDAFLDTHEFPDGSIHMTRWFWMSSQRYGIIRIENSTATLHEPGQTIFKPTNGFLIIKNSTITGNVRPETISRFSIHDSKLTFCNDQVGYATIKEAVEVNDDAVGEIVRSELEGDLKVGWSSTNLFLGRADPVVLIDACSYKGEKYELYANTSMHMRDCDLSTDAELVISDRTSLDLVRTDLGSITVDCGMHERLVAIPENVSITLTDSKVGRVKSMEAQVRIDLTMDRSAVGTFDVHYKDVPVDKVVNVTLIGDSSLRMKNTSAANVTVVLRDAPMPTGLGDEVSVHQRRLLRCAATINGRPLEDGSFELMGSIGRSDANGSYQVMYDSKIWRGADLVFSAPDVTNVSLSYFGLNQTVSVPTNKDRDILFELNDVIGPSITSVALEPGTFNQKEFIRIRARVTDGEVGVVSDVHLRYKVGRGEWQETAMAPLGNGMYEAILDRMGIGTRLEYRVEAADILGNEGACGPSEETIGSELLMILIGIASLSILASTFMLVLFLRRRSVVRRYAMKKFDGSYGGYSR
jgi:hypothetical protein